MNIRKQLESKAVDGRVSIDDAIIVARAAVAEYAEKALDNTDMREDWDYMDAIDKEEAMEQFMASWDTENGVKK